MDKKKEETFQSSEDSMEKSETETQSTSSTDAPHIEEEKTSEKDISAENEPEPSPESSLTVEDEQATELEEDKPVSEIEETEIIEEEKPVFEVEEIKPLEEEPVKEEVPPKPKKVVIVKEVKEKTKDKIIKKVKRTTLIVLIIISLILVGGMYAWTSGMDDLRADNDYLIVVVFKEVEAASIYHKDTGESEVIEVTELEKISDRKRFFESVQKKYGVLDRMIIIDVDTLYKLSTDDYILYQDDPNKKIYRDEMYDWLIGKDFPRPEIQGNDSPSEVNANMLKSWLDHYQEKLFGNWGSNTIKVVLNGYRSDKIIISPGNSALFILKYISIEKILLPM
jgi:hypothetical protein